MGKSFDIIVVGGGHAGVEASFVGAKLGMNVCLVTTCADSIGRMSCNPAVGGLAKSRVVREVDAMGGVIGIAADRTAIQYRVLNRKKGPAVQATRCQNDRKQYEKAVREIIMNVERLTVVEGSAYSILSEGRKVFGIRLKSGEELYAKAVILATGTFLGGKIFIGHDEFPGGRIDEAPQEELTKSLRKLGLRILRFKTGTPPRIKRSTVDFSRVTVQHGEDDVVPFSIDTESVLPKDEQEPCFITHTTPETHKLVLENIKFSALYGGKIVGVGPRYCPSIEVKVKNFPHHPKHIVFLEPEGRGVDEMYPNGVSNSLPAEIQLAMLRTIPGLENVEMTRPGYAVEYDVVEPVQISHSLMAREVDGLFFAGQIMGTSGYEEAAGLGVIAGINASFWIMGRSPLILTRDKSYIAVMIDDLVTRGADEPYRLLTGRAEFKLLLREDNAWLSIYESIPHDLLEKISGERFLVMKEWHERMIKTMEFIEKTYIKRDEAKKLGVEQGTPLSKYCRRPDAKWDMLEKIYPEIADLMPQPKRTLAIELKYAGYIEHQRREAEKLRKVETMTIPEDLEFDGIGLRREAAEKFARFRPKTIGQAMRIPGITPSDVAVLVAVLKKLFHVKHKP